MNAGEQSYRLVVPKKPSNNGNGAPLPAEAGEERGLVKVKAGETHKVRAQERIALQQKLARIRQKATSDKEMKFTTLWHHVYDVDRLRESFFRLSRDSSPGVDGQTWRDYGEELEANLADLSGRLKRGAYHAKPVKRTYIPKADGRRRPIGMPTVEDKIVQRSTAEVLGAVYEADFKGFSYGFRPGRHQHNALDALSVGLTYEKVNWVIDADIRGFFDSIDHGWLVRFIEHRVTDKRIIRQINKWLSAGVLEDGKLVKVTEGTPQGGSISPLLANIYLHYVFDLWAAAWRKDLAKGRVIFVRYADDIVIGCQSQDDAGAILAGLTQRLTKFSLELHRDKTRLLEFGRFSAENRASRGQRRPETFDFLGFTHIVGKNSKGRYMVHRKTSRKKATAKLMDLKREMRRRRRLPIPVQGAWLRAVLRGHYQYYGVPTNRSLGCFRHRVSHLWHDSLIRRSQKHRLTWERMGRLCDKWLPLPSRHHPLPWERLRVRSRDKNPMQ